MTMTADPARAVRLAERQRRRRLDEAGRRLLVCAKLYAPDRFDLPWCDAHRRCAAALEEAFRAGGGRVAAALPRRAGKTSLFALALPMWAAAFCGARRIAIITLDNAEAQERIDELAEAMASPLLAVDVPAARTRRARGRRVELAGGAEIVAAPAQTPWRRLRRRGRGPDLLILDDAQSLDPEPESRFMYEHEDPGPFSRTLAPWLDRGLEAELSPAATVAAVGSIAGRNALLTDLVDHAMRPGWKKIAVGALRLIDKEGLPLWRQWSAIELGRRSDGGPTGAEAARAFYLDNRAAMDRAIESFWPAAFPVEPLVRRGTRAFNDRRASRTWSAQMENNPIDHEPCFWSEPGVPCGDRYDATAELHEEGKNARLWTAHDPDILNPDRDRSFPEIAMVRECLKTGEKVAMDHFLGRRKIHYEWVLELKERLARERDGEGPRPRPATGPGGAP